MNTTQPSLVSHFIQPHGPNSRPSSPTRSDIRSDITKCECHLLADASLSPTSVVHGREMPVPYHAIHGRDLIRAHSENFDNDVVKKMNQMAMADHDSDSSTNDSDDNPKP